MRVKESKLWLLFLIAGAIIIVLLGIHMIIMHCDHLVATIIGSTHKPVLSYESVAQRSKSIIHVIIYLLLLALALFHGFYGFRSIVQELPIPASFRGYVDALSIAAGIVLFVFGAIAIVKGFIL